mmetsp:Transcript_41309/g.106900  ORF Transcript_41309/g.106900 Transcript_41309/m.106900 type:complete len:238 (+) Transcript_41309:180-893(+)
MIDDRLRLLAHDADPEDVAEVVSGAVALGAVLVLAHIRKPVVVVDILEHGTLVRHPCGVATLNGLERLLDMVGAELCREGHLVAHLGHELGKHEQHRQNEADCAARGHLRELLANAALTLDLWLLLVLALQVLVVPVVVVVARVHALLELHLLLALPPEPLLPRLVIRFVELEYAHQAEDTHDAPSLRAQPRRPATPHFLGAALFLAAAKAGDGLGDERQVHDERRSREEVQPEEEP